MEIQAVEYRRKGINAYMDKVTIDQSGITEHNFFHPDRYEEGDRRFKGQSVKCWFNISQYPDGYYILREGQAGSSKEYYSFFLIKNGDIDTEFDSKKEMLNHASPLPCFPDLKGSEKQVNWAKAIREKCYRKQTLKADFTMTSAKYWIDNFKSI